MREIIYRSALQLIKYGSVDKINEHVSKKITKRERNTLKGFDVKLNKLVEADVFAFMRIMLDRVIKKDREEMNNPDTDQRSKINRKKRK